MILFALFACVFSAFQIFVVASLGRSLSARYCLAAFLAGMAASFALTLLAELAIASFAAAEPGRAFRQAVRLRSYGVDPLVEEFCKLLPLLGLILLARVRKTLGFVDIVLLSACLGAGFGFMESALSLGSVASSARWIANFLLVSGGGFSMSQLAVPDPWASATSWLPNPTNVLGPMEDPATLLNGHVAYSIFAGIGSAILIKARRLWWLGLPALAYSVLDHIGFNADAARADLPLFLSPVLQILRPLDGLLVLAAIVAATAADRRTFRRVLDSHDALRLALAGAEAGLGAHSVLGALRNFRALPSLWHFTLERRAYLIASAAGERGEAQAALGERLEAFAQSLRTGDVRHAPPPPEAGEAAPARRRIGRRLLTALVMVIAAPPLFYWTAIGFVRGDHLAALFGSPPVFAGLIALTVAGILLAAFTAVTQLRALLPGRTRLNPRAALWHSLSLQTALGSIALSLLVLTVSIGQDPLQPLGAAHAIQRWLNAHPVAALTLAVAVATLVNVAIELSPLGRLRSMIETLTGVDALTRRKLTLFERAMGVLPGAKTSRSVARSLDDIKSLRGASVREIEALIPKHFVRKPTRFGNGIRFLNPERQGESIRIMPGKPNDPDIVKRGPYLRISRNKVSGPIPLKGNGVLND
jgi:hypothetical protein